MRQELNGFSNLEITAKEQKVAFIFSSVVGTVTRADLFHQSDGAVSCGFCTMCTSLCICACVGQARKGPQVSLLPKCSLSSECQQFKEEKRTHFSKISAAAPGPVSKGELRRLWGCLLPQKSMQRRPLPSTGALSLGKRQPEPLTRKGVLILKAVHTV